MKNKCDLSLPHTPQSHHQSFEAALSRVTLIFTVSCFFSMPPSHVNTQPVERKVPVTCGWCQASKLLASRGIPPTPIREY